jgi:hypothetical protein
MSESRVPWWVGPAAWFGALVLRVLGRTWRLTRVGVEEHDAVVAGGQRCIYTFWHGRMLPLVWYHRGCGVAVLVSRSRDGELIARMAEWLGYVTARGSSHRGGREGALEMLEWAERGRRLAVTPDGPRGPAEVVKPGLVWMAARTGYRVLPVASAATRAWVARSWDGFRIPLPFARVVIAYGTAIELPRDLDEASGEQWRRRLEEALRAATEDARRRAGELT